MSALASDPRRDGLPLPTRVRAGASAKLSPATQMSRMLASSRKAGTPFDRAWSSAIAHCRWPHNTEERIAWKERLSEDREEWEAAYSRTGDSRRSLTALYRLITMLEEDRLAA